MKCDICDVEMEAENFEAWFKAAHIHYTSDHAGVMKEMQEKGTKEEGQKWMADARKRFEAI